MSINCCKGALKSRAQATLLEQKELTTRRLPLYIIILLFFPLIVYTCQL